MTTYESLADVTEERDRLREKLAELLAAKFALEAERDRLLRVVRVCADALDGVMREKKP